MLQMTLRNEISGLSELVINYLGWINLLMIWFHHTHFYMILNYLFSRNVIRFYYFIINYSSYRTTCFVSKEICDNKCDQSIGIKILRAS